MKNVTHFWNFCFNNFKKKILLLKNTFKQLRYIATEAITQAWTCEEKKNPAGKEIYQKLAVYVHDYRIKKKINKEIV